MSIEMTSQVPLLETITLSRRQEFAAQLEYQPNPTDIAMQELANELDIEVSHIVTTTYPFTLRGMVAIDKGGYVNLETAEIAHKGTRITLSKNNALTKSLEPAPYSEPAPELTQREIEYYQRWTSIGHVPDRGWVIPSLYPKAEGKWKWDVSVSEVKEHLVKWGQVVDKLREAPDTDIPWNVVSPIYIEDKNALPAA